MSENLSEVNRYRHVSLKACKTRLTHAQFIRHFGNFGNLKRWLRKPSHLWY